MANKNLAARIIDLRESVNMTQTELAKLLKIDKSAMSKIENGTRKVSSDELKQIAEIFKVTTDYLVGRSDDNLLVVAHVDDDWKNLPAEQQKAIRDFIEFQKQKYIKEHEDEKKD